MSSLVEATQTVPKELQDSDLNPKECYNDHEFYRGLLTDFLNSAEQVDGGTDDKDYLFGADLSMTQKHIMKK